MLRRYSGQIRLIVASHLGDCHDSRAHIPSFVKAIALAQDWVITIVAGEYKNQRAIAKAMGVDERYISHVIAGAFLAPKIVEAVADGGGLPAINLPFLLNNASLSWKEQYAEIDRLRLTC